MLTVKRFNDQTRKLYDYTIDPGKVDRVSRRTRMLAWGDRNQPTSVRVRQVWLTDGTWHFLFDDGTLPQKLGVQLPPDDQLPIPGEDVVELPGEKPPNATELPAGTVADIPDDHEHD